jgi:hypothetical protein
MLNGSLRRAGKTDPDLITASRMADSVSYLISVANRHGLANIALRLGRIHASLIRMTVKQHALTSSCPADVRPSTASKANEKSGN